jgi:hypothetical protein
MKNWFNPADAEELAARLRRITPDLRPRWGKMSAHEVVVHLADPCRTALGDKPVQLLGGPLNVPGISQFVLWIAPWPKGAPTAPDYLPGTGMSNATDFEADRRALLGLLDRMTSHDGEFAPNPVFGRLSRRGWGRQVWRHVDHHLRQFGT